MTWEFNHNRPPGLLERYINHFTVGMDAHEYVGNPALKPEVNYQTDLSLSYNRSLLHFKVDLFYARFNNYISAKVDTALPGKYIPCLKPPYAKRFVNVHGVKQTGFETMLRFNLPLNCSINSRTSYTYAQNLSWNEPLAEIAPLTTVSSFRYQTSKFKGSFEYELTADQTRISKSFGENKTNGYQVFHLRLAYHPFPYLSLQGGITNILNEYYTQHLSRSYKNSPAAGLAFYEPGRSLFFGLQVQNF